MIPIEFRLWDYNKNRMKYLKNAQIEFDDNGKPYHISFDGGYGYWVGGYEGELGRNKCELMQFIGCLDKSGKKIFENDILEYSDKSEYGVVKFGDGEFYLETELKNWRSDIYGTELVIGNIYENEDLVRRQP